MDERTDDRINEPDRLLMNRKPRVVDHGEHGPDDGGRRRRAAAEEEFVFQLNKKTKSVNCRHAAVLLNGTNSNDVVCTGYEG
jgi:hypothetical protein